MLINKMRKLKDTRYLCGVLLQASSRPRVRDFLGVDSEEGILFIFIPFYFVYLSMFILSSFGTVIRVG
jgi:hypothetical protein